MKGEAVKLNVLTYCHHWRAPPRFSRHIVDSTLNLLVFVNSRKPACSQPPPPQRWSGCSSSSAWLFLGECCWYYDKQGFIFSSFQSGTIGPRPCTVNPQEVCFGVSDTLPAQNEWPCESESRCHQNLLHSGRRIISDTPKKDLCRLLSESLWLTGGADV